MNSRILHSLLRDAKTMSYQVIAERRGLTRNQIAGAIWRHKNPPGTRSPNGKSNKCGRGYRGPSYIPKKTAWTSR